jgi:hypothetical protein
MRSNRSRRTPLGTVLAIALAAIALALPTAAFAQQLTPPDVEYQPALDLSVEGAPGGGSPSATSRAGTLPFTGLDLVAFAAVGAGLLGAGFAIRRAAKSG